MSDMYDIHLQNNRSKILHIIRQYRVAMLAATDASAYAPCLRPRRKLILTAMLLKLSQINLKMMAIPKIGK